MKIGMITSFPPSRDGVSAYSAKLIKAMLNVKGNVRILVLSDKQSDINNGRLMVVKVWKRNTFLYPLRIFKTLAWWHPQAIHCQHEYWLYGRHFYSVTFLLLLAILRFLWRPIVITMHCVIPIVELTEAFFRKHGLGGRLAFTKKMFVLLYTMLMNLLSSRIIVHSEISRSILINDYRFNKGKTLVIPHGIGNSKEHSFLNQDEARKILRFSSGPILLVFGEIRRGKGIEHAIRAMPRILDAHPSSQLIVAGTYDPTLSPESAGYLEELITLSKIMGVEENVVFRINVSEEQIPMYFAAADITLFPYTEDEILASSGPLSIAVSFGKPIVATNIKRFKDMLRNGENSILIPPACDYCIAEAVNKLLENQKLMYRLSQNAKLIANERSWRNIALKALKLYEELINKHD